jgi:hypothetical protein
VTRKNNRRRLAAGGAEIPGLRATMRRNMARRLNDPRVMAREELSIAERRELNETSPVVIEAKQFIAPIDRGDTVCVPRIYADGNSHPEGRAIPWIKSVSMILVDAQDCIRPA